MKYLEQQNRTIVLFLLILLAMLGLLGCKRETEPTPAPTQTPNPPPLAITYCDIDPSDLCLEGFGQEADGQMLILFIANDRSFANIDVHIDLAGGEIPLDCEQSQSFLENVYCIGRLIPDGDKIRLKIYSADSGVLIARGVFIVAYGNLPKPDVLFQSETQELTPIPPSTPPSYPNPTYPNSTSVP